MKTKFLFNSILIAILILQNCKSDNNTISDTERRTLFYLATPNRTESPSSNTITYQTTFTNNCKTVSTPVKIGSEVNAEDIYSIDDMLFKTSADSESNEIKSAYKTGCANLWDGAVIPFEISPSYSNINALYSAFTAWENETSIRFVKRTNLHKDYIHIASSTVCSSFVGRIGGKQSVNLSSSCTYNNILHELGHVIGFYHEHQRVDRDNFILINTGNIRADSLRNFDKLLPRYTYSSDYDIHSVMHYTAYAFSANSRPTISLRYQNTNFGNQGILSNLDKENANTIYKNNFKVLNNIPAGYYRL